MREIEFRAFWRGRMHNVGQLCAPMNGKSLTVFSEAYVNMGEVPLMQFVGIYDNIKRKIFEGDIVEYQPHYLPKSLFVIVWDNGGFYLQNSLVQVKLSSVVELIAENPVGFTLNVIGNIYENEEMLSRLRAGE